MAALDVRHTLEKYSEARTWLWVYCTPCLWTEWTHGGIRAHGNVLISPVLNPVTTSFPHVGFSWVWSQKNDTYSENILLNTIKRHTSEDLHAWHSPSYSTSTDKWACLRVVLQYLSILTHFRLGWHPTFENCKLVSCTLSLFFFLLFHILKY